MTKLSKKVFLGMSGGVDSSVAAYLLLQQGYDVVGIFMKNWSGVIQNTRGIFTFACSAQADFEDAQSVAYTLGIPLYTFDFEQEYADRVISYFISELKRGRTPNPDIMCNKEIKFKVFLEKSLALGADLISTGHYARVSQSDNTFQLLKGIDQTKDQSYFLSTLGQPELSKTLFPIGTLEKSEVRQIAQRIGLGNAQKPDSQGICFVGEIDVNEFIRSYVDEKPGDIVDQEGRKLGQHKGIYFYTIGQRKGLGIGGGKPYFVVDKDVDNNRLIVSKALEDNRLYKTEVTIDTLSWTNLEPNLPITLQAKIRYRSKDVVCTLDKDKSELDNPDRLTVQFDKPQRAVTSGQFIVFYSGDNLMGSGVIR